MKAILIAITPKWVELILRGLKTVEIRKRIPHINGPFKVYIYVTRGKFDITFCDDLSAASVILTNNARGKVVGEFICDKTDIVRNEEYGEIGFVAGGVEEDMWTSYAKELIEKSCVPLGELNSYLKYDYGYFMHISDLKVYDTPKELNEFEFLCKNGKTDYNTDIYCRGCRYAFQGTVSGEVYCDRTVVTAPQSWFYVRDLAA